jgi:hypothetical protein
MPRGKLRLPDPAHTGEHLAHHGGAASGQRGGRVPFLEAVRLPRDDTYLYGPGGPGRCRRVVVLVVVDATADIAGRDGTAGGGEGEPGRGGGAAG